MASLLERKEFSKLMICALYYPCMDILEKNVCVVSMYYLRFLLFFL